MLSPQFRDSREEDRPAVARLWSSVLCEPVTAETLAAWNRMGQVHPNNWELDLETSTPQPPSGTLTLEELGDFDRFHAALPAMEFGDVMLRTLTAPVEGRSGD